jgi:hypothetical protein
MSLDRSYCGKPLAKKCSVQGSRSDAGASLIETILLGLLFLVPVIWALGVFSEMHRGALAATAGAREAGFEIGRVTSPADASRAADMAVGQAFADHGLDASKVTVSLSTSGLDRGEPVEVKVGYPVTIFQAPLLGRVAGPSIWIRAEHVTRVDPYRSRP